MNALRYQTETWENLAPEIKKQKLVQLRREGAVVRVSGPSKPVRAHTLGYRARNGFVVVRIRIGKGASKRERPNRGRKPSKAGQLRFSAKQSQAWIAEQRANRKFPNLEVLNSYYLIEDGSYRWFEVILVDPQVSLPSHLDWMKGIKGRVYRGLTSAGKKGRGLMYKGEGVEKVRPSVSRHANQGK